MSNEVQEVEVPAEPAPKTYSAGALSALEARFSTKASAGGGDKKIKRRTAEVEIPKSICEPGAFDEDILVGIEGLSSAEELESYRKATDGTVAGLEMARRSLRTLNRQPMRSHQRDLLWEVLGMAGRAFVMNAYMTECSGAASADLGKLQSVKED